MLSTYLQTGDRTGGQEQQLLLVVGISLWNEKLATPYNFSSSPIMLDDKETNHRSNSRLDAIETAFQHHIVLQPPHLIVSCFD